MGFLGNLVDLSELVEDSRLAGSEQDAIPAATANKSNAYP